MFTKYENIDEIPNILPSPHKDIPEFEVDNKGVTELLNNLNVNKSVGPDGISAKELKMLAPIVSPALTAIFNQSIFLNQVPNDFKTAFICCILKPDKEKTDPASYRPVSLTSICGKMLEHIVYSQCIKHQCFDKIRTWI